MIFAPGSITMKDFGVHPATVVPAGIVKVAPDVTFTFPSRPYILLASNVVSVLIMLSKTVTLASHVVVVEEPPSEFEGVEEPPLEELPLHPARVTITAAAKLSVIFFLCIIVVSKY